MLAAVELTLHRCAQTGNINFETCAVHRLAIGHLHCIGSPAPAALLAQSRVYSYIAIVSRCTWGAMYNMAACQSSQAGCKRSSVMHSKLHRTAVAHNCAKSGTMIVARTLQHAVDSKSSSEHEETESLKVPSKLLGKQPCCIHTGCLQACLRSQVGCLQSVSNMCVELH